MNTQSLQAFIDKVQAEANEASQAVYDKYEAELIKRIQGQLHKKHKMYIAMGSAHTENTDTKYTVCEELNSIVTQLCYPDTDSAFRLPYIITKDEIKND